jgi:DNA-directed RNA polymerase specialized sigma54-like protein
MAKATIKSKTGAIITVEGTEKEVANILTSFENTVTIARAKEVMTKSKIAKKDKKKRTTASDLITNLREEGYFDKPRNLTDIANALVERGYLYPVTTLSAVMINLVQKRIFGRKKIDGKWMYGK